jgi:DNA-binding PadR family transcriptional regulator
MRAACAPDGRGYGRFGHRGFTRERGRRGRIFAQGDLRYALLQLIADKPSHGYELIKAIEDRLGGAYSPSPGVVYPTLTLLEELGYISALQAEGARRAYEVTDEGRAALAANKATVEAIFRRIAEAAERLGASPPHQIVRAMENLRVALRLRLERGALSEAQIADVAAALDAAAHTVERE